MIRSRLELAEGWALAAEREHRSEQLSADEYEPIMELLDLCFRDPIEAAHTVVCILSLRPRDYVLKRLGAGPIEQILDSSFGDVAEILRQGMAKQPDASICLNCVIVDDDHQRRAEVLRLIDELDRL